MKKNFVKEGIFSYLYKILIFWFLIGYIILPIFSTFSEAITVDGKQMWSNLGKYITNPKNLIIIGNTLKMGLFTVVICGIIGISMAFFMTFHCTKLKKLIHLLLLTPMMVPGIIIVIAYWQLYGDTGILTSIICQLLRLSSSPYSITGFKGILFVHAFTQYVHFYLQTYIALKYVDYSEIEVAQGLGASKVRIFIDIIFPTIKPAIILAATMTFILGISSYSAPSILGQGFRVLSTQIATSKANFDFQMASLGALVLFGISFFVLLVSQYINRKNRNKRNLRATQYTQKNNSKLTVVQVIEYLVVFIVLMLIILPIIGILYLSFVDNQTILSKIIPNNFTLVNYCEVFSSKRTIDPFFNSIKMAMFVVIVGFTFTVPLSYMVSKKKSLSNNLAWFLVTLSWCIPGSVLAVNLITSFNHANIFSFGNALIGGYYILPIAYTINALPLMMNNNMVAMENFNPSLEDASRGLGAGKIQTFIKIVLPCVFPGIISGGMLAIINTLGEYTISNLLYGIHNQPISVAMLKRFTNYCFGETMAYASVVIFICIVLFTIVFKLDKKRYF